MPDAPYSNREIDQRFNGLEHRLFDDEEGYLPRIEKQTKYTNGKVRKITVALVLVFGILIGQNFTDSKAILSLLAGLN